MIRFNEINRDQYVPNDQYVPEIKMEDDEESYYNIGANNFLQRNGATTRFNEFKMPPISSFCAPSAMTDMYNNNNFVRSHIRASSDGECSPNSIDENEIQDINNVPCIRGVRTITRNPGRVAKPPGKAKGKGRGRKNENSIPKEKDRARLFNQAFDGLRKRIPSIPASKKLSKIEILRLAICYMAYLKFLLDCDLPTRITSETVTETASPPSPSSPISETSA